MIGLVFQPMRSTHAGPIFANFMPMIPHGCFFSSFRDAYEVVRSLRSQGYGAEVKVTSPNYSI